MDMIYLVNTDLTKVDFLTKLKAANKCKEAFLNSKIKEMSHFKLAN